MSHEDQSSSQTLMGRFGERFGVDPLKLFETLKQVAFRQKNGGAISNEQMMALLIVAEQYNLNPFLKEIYAYPDKNNGIVPVVGWVRIVNAHPEYDGFEVVYSPDKVRAAGVQHDVHEWIEVAMFRKDRTRPTRVREFMDECYRAPFVTRDGFNVAGPWQTHPKRLLRHKAYIQSARLAFGFTGIYDQDEAERIIDADSNTVGASVKVVTPEGESVKTSTSEQAMGATGNAPPQLPKPQMDIVLNELLSRTLRNQTWSVAHQYVEQRFTGENLETAKTFLHDKQMEHMQVPNQDYEAMQQCGAEVQEHYANGDRVESVMPPLDDSYLAQAGEDGQGESAFY